ncbi:hypothetical protein F1880_001776 [Penicillium rolfsii]|nr:hypothetical protein F1880_001776 [Penicillium rolfsii]
MVKIAIAGGSGNVGQEIIDVLVATKKHEILILSRKDAPAGETNEGITWAQTDYKHKEQLARILQGTHTLLSFVGDEPAAPVQKNLIDAAVQAGVKRFAPSEWASAGLEHLHWYAYKGETRRYLKELNKDKKVLEYTLFQPGTFTNYFTAPFKSSDHVQQVELPWDFYHRRAIVLEGSENDRMSLTTSRDVANVVARAIEYEGEWPVVGGIRGSELSVQEIIALGEKVRGGRPFDIQKVTAEAFETGEWVTSWVPRINHPSIPPEQVDVLSKVFTAGVLLAIHDKAYQVSDEWNRLLPDYEFTDIEDFLTKAWRGKA